MCSKGEYKILVIININMQEVINNRCIYTITLFMGKLKLGRGRSRHGAERYRTERSRSVNGEVGERTEQRR